MCEKAQTERVNTRLFAHSLSRPAFILPVRVDSSISSYQQRATSSQHHMLATRSHGSAVVGHAQAWRIAVWPLARMIARSFFFAFYSAAHSPAGRLRPLVFGADLAHCRYIMLLSLLFRCWNGQSRTTWRRNGSHRTHRASPCAISIAPCACATSRGSYRRLQRT